MTGTFLARALTRVELNPRYAVDLGNGDLCILRFDGGMWASKIRHRDGRWFGYIAPRRSTAADPVLIAVGDDHDDVRSVMLRWTDQAVTLACRINAVVWAGTGDALYESADPDDVPTCWPSLNTTGAR